MLSCLVHHGAGLKASLQDPLQALLSLSLSPFISFHFIHMAERQLYYAAYSGDDREVTRLLDQGVNIDSMIVRCL